MTLTTYVATNRPTAPDGLLRPTKWPIRRLMAKNAITSRPPNVPERSPTQPLKISARMPVSNSAPPAAAELRPSRPSHRDRLEPDAPTDTLPDGGPGSALEVIRSQSSGAGGGFGAGHTCP